MTGTLLLRVKTHNNASLRLAEGEGRDYELYVIKRYLPTLRILR